ncbi:RNAse (barnase) inhibitor barstar [Bradyrhizobium diazoefficiens]|uniref:GmrSD restriction endonuclease domain-containing protein n=1 Tax=Bradyrhizobium diazoefficiens TaxID=1355477 RepID=UPI003510FB3D
MAEVQKSRQDLTVKGESVERVYGNYQAWRYIVNRRYQRKLVWTLDEKRRFIDSIVSGYPVPIVLLAERKVATGSSQFEIIDGMQRLNAVFGFIENEYDVNGHFFDLNTMAETKALLDAGKLQQREPLLAREACVQVASYTVPLSIYEFTGDGEVDEVFRRINSGGRKLSRQELRIAGSTGHFAQAVRNIAAKVRGDVSASDELPLNEMKKISITNRELSYGIDVDEVFWIKQGVLTKEQVRESRDEEIIADILAYMLLEPKPPSRSEVLDDFFGFSDGEAQQQRHQQIELATQKVTTEVAAADFQRVLDQLKITLNRAGRTLGQLLLGEQPPRAPRYFQVVFLAMHKLMVMENQEVVDQDQLIKLLDGSGAKIQVPEGGRWGAEDRTNLVNGAAGMYGAAFGPAKAYDPARVRWITQLENILTQSHTEQAAYDFKQGFLRLDGKHTFDEDSWTKILKTLAAIANIRKGLRGYVLVGVADTEADAKRVTQVYGVDAKPFERFFMTGVEHEAKALGRTLDDLFMELTTRIKKSPLSEPLRDYVARNVKLVRYYDKVIYVFEAQAQEEPSNYDGAFYVRHGNKIAEVPSTQFGELFKRFMAGR